MSEIFTLIDQSFIGSLAYGVFVALLTCILSTLTALSLVYALSIVMIQGKKKNFMAFFAALQTPLSIPYALSALLLFLLLYPAGFLGSLSPYFFQTPFGIILAYMYKVCAFLVLVAYPVLFSITRQKWHYFKMFGDSYILFFRHTILPKLLLPYTIANYLIFSYVLGAYEIPFLLGNRTEPMPAVLIMETLQSIHEHSLSQAYSMSFVLFACILTSGIVFFLLYRYAKKAIRV